MDALYYKYLIQYLIRIKKIYSTNQPFEYGLFPVVYTIPNCYNYAHSCGDSSARRDIIAQTLARQPNTDKHEQKVFNNPTALQMPSWNSRILIRLIKMRTKKKNIYSGSVYTTST